MYLYRIDSRNKIWNKKWIWNLNTKSYRLFNTRTVRPMAVSPHVWMFRPMGILPHGSGTNISPYTRHFTPWAIPDDSPCIQVSPHVWMFRPMGILPHGCGENISRHIRHFAPWTIPDDSPCIDVSPHERGAKRLHNNCRTNLQARYDLFCVKSAVKPQPTNQL